MLLQTKVDIQKAPFTISPSDNLLFVGSCFADNIGRRFIENKFNAIVNPYGVMYNPASIYHTVERLVHSTPPLWRGQGGRAIFTLGTNHVYILKEIGEIVDNCQKRPQSLFEERELSVDECADYLNKAIALLRQHNPDIKVILTVSPIRYQKYGFHGSQLSKSTLMLAAQKVIAPSLAERPERAGDESYFPAYEIMNDELRDYRFYEPDMLHPSQQAVDYIYEQFKEMFFSPEALQFEREWQPIKQALNHRPFNPDLEEYKTFLAKVKEQEKQFYEKWGCKNLGITK